MKLLTHKIKKWKPDAIQISSFAIAKNIGPFPETRLELYLHSPMQYVGAIMKNTVLNLADEKNGFSYYAKAEETRSEIYNIWPSVLQ